MNIKIENDLEEIKNDNCAGLCAHKYCDKRYTQFITIEIAGMPVIISFCDEHAEVWKEKTQRNYYE